MQRGVLLGLTMLLGLFSTEPSSLVAQSAASAQPHPAANIDTPTEDSADTSDVNQAVYSNSMQTPKPLVAEALSPTAPSAETSGPWHLSTVYGEGAFRHADDVTAIVPLSDGRVLSTARDGTARLWDPATGREVRRYVHPTDADIWGAVLLPDGERFCTVGGNTGLYVWSLDGTTCLHWPISVTEQTKSGKKSRRGALCLALCPTGEMLAVGGRFGWVYEFSLPAFQPARPWKAYPADPYTICFLRGGAVVGVGGPGGAPEFYTHRTKTKRERPVVNAGIINALVPRPGTEEEVLVCSETNGAWLMDLSSGETGEAFRRGEDILQGRFTPAVGRLLLAGWDGATLRDLPTGEEMVLLDGPTFAAAFSADGAAAWVSRGNQLCRFETASGNRTIPSGARSISAGPVRDVAPLGDGETMLQCGPGLGVHKIELRTGRRRATWAGDDEWDGVLPSPDGTVVLVWNLREARVLDADSGKTRFTVPIPGEALRLRARFAVGGEQVHLQADGEFYLRYSTATGELLQRRSTTDVVYSSPGSTLGLTWSYPNLLYLLELDEQGQWRRLPGVELRIPADKARDGIVLLTAARVLPRGKGILAETVGEGVFYWSGEGALAELLATPALVRQWVTELSAPSLHTREEAQRKLIQAGQTTKAVLRGYTPRSAEEQLRIDRILAGITGGTLEFHQPIRLDWPPYLLDRVAVLPDAARLAVPQGAGVGVGGRIVIHSLHNDGLTPVQSLDAPHLPRRLRFFSEEVLVSANGDGSVGIYRKEEPSPSAAATSQPAKPTP